jgi:hypothetical protein
MISRQSFFSSPWRFFDCAANECQKLLFGEWLLQVTVRPMAHHCFSDWRIVYSGDVSEWNTRIMLLHVQEKREAIHQRQEQVRQYEVDPSSSGQQFYCRPTVRRFPAIEPVPEQPRDDNVPDRLLILDQKDSW